MRKFDRRLNRREFLLLTGSAGIGAVLAGCNFPSSKLMIQPTDAAAPGTTALPTDGSTQAAIVLPTDMPTAVAPTEASSFKLPCSFDFNTLPDGGLPEWFSGVTWQVTGGTLTNTPALGEELLKDPGLEADYAGGLGCVSLMAFDNPILKQSIDTHGGSKSQQFQADAPNSAVYWTPLAGEVGAWYQFSVWGKRIAGSGKATRMSLAQSGGLPAAQAEWAITGESYQQGKVSLLSTSSENLTPTAAMQIAAVGLDTVVVVDDGSLRKMDKASLFGLLPATQADVVIKIKPDELLDNTPVGIVLRADAGANPTAYALVLFSIRADAPAEGNLNVIKVRGSSYTSLMSSISLGARVSDAWLEVRAVGSTISLYYNHAKLGEDLTIGDAAFGSKQYHGLFSAGDNRLKGFFAAESLLPRVQVFAGSSFTASPGYRPAVAAYCQSHFPQYDYTFPLLAIGRHNTWSNLARLTTGGDVFILDHANDTSADFVEAMILRLWAMNPATQIILITSPSWNSRDTSDDSQVNTPANFSVLQDIQALAVHYGIALVDYWAWCISSVNQGTYHLKQLTDDTIHPSENGYAAMADLVEHLLPEGGTAMPAKLPMRFFPNSAFLETPSIRIEGTGYFKRTGNGWVDDGTTISSSTPGDTVTYTTKELWSSFGGWRSDSGANVVEVKLNEGEFQAVPFNYNGYELYSATYNEITIRIPAGGNVRIEQVWLI